MIRFRSDFDVELVDSMGGDDAVLRAMLVSTLKDGAVETMSDSGKSGRIGFLMRNRHGTPFEHAAITVRVSAPIFVFREWHRHRIASINEQSGRYTEFEPVFYVPPAERPIVQVGKPGAYQYVSGDDLQFEWLVADMKGQAESQWSSYQARLERGIALEVARMSLGVNLYSTMYWTCNPRSLMNFLSLRVACPSKEEWEGSAGDSFGWSSFPSRPMYEIDACARAVEEMFATGWPLTYTAFLDNGRVAP